MKTLIFALSLVSIQALAQYHYDPQTGNSYTQMGNTTFGSNARTGSTWTTTNTQTGSYGTDSHGNTWNYDRSSNIYRNSNGTVCSGEGALRRCY